MEASADLCRLDFICHHDAGGHFTSFSDLRERSECSANFPHPLISDAMRRMVRGEDKPPGDYRRKSFDSSSLAANAGIPHRTARWLLAVLCDHGILRMSRPGTVAGGRFSAFEIDRGR